MTKSRSEINYAYSKKAYDDIRVQVPKGKREEIAQFAQSRGLSVNGLVNGLLMREMGMSETEWKAKPDAEAAD